MRGAINDNFVGLQPIHAKDDIKAGEELFYDYHYTKYQKTPKWFRELSKKKESKNSRGKGRIGSKIK
jgi:SET domain-containing protein